MENNGDCATYSGPVLRFRTRGRRRHPVPGGQLVHVHQVSRLRVHHEIPSAVERLLALDTHQRHAALVQVPRPFCWIKKRRVNVQPSSVADLSKFLGFAILFLNSVLYTEVERILSRKKLPRMVGTRDSLVWGMFERLNSSRMRFAKHRRSISNYKRLRLKKKAGKRISRRNFRTYNSISGGKFYFLNDKIGAHFYCYRLVDNINVNILVNLTEFSWFSYSTKQLY